MGKALGPNVDGAIIARCASKLVENKHIKQISI